MPCVKKSAQNLKPWGLILLCGLIIICYSNTFHAAWHLDDLPNIVNNARLQLSELSIDGLKQALKASPAHPGKHYYRPLPCLSFAINWFLGGDNPFGYHLVNLTVHLATTCFLYWTIQLLLLTPALSTRQGAQHRHFIALLATALWALNPVQIQAVTYIVQRMAAMAAMFSIAGIYFYLRGRMTSGLKRWLWYAAMTAAAGCGLLSKENALLFPFSVLLVEYIFFRHTTAKGHAKNWFSMKNVAIAGILLVTAAVIVLHVTGNPISLARYQERSFSLWQRLISQPRVLMLYVSLIFYPAPWRLSIEHNFSHSLALTDPWTTLPAVFCVLGLLVFALSSIRKYPLLSFGILFFFLNHLVESTILPLEMVFEHRNYLPSLFLFLPVAWVANKVVLHYQSKQRLVYMLLLSCLAVVIAANGYACYLRNAVWRSGYSLWYDAVKKAPRNSRPLTNLGIALGWGKENVANRYDIALGLFHRALPLKSSKKHLPAKIYGNIGLVHVMKGELPEACKAYREALAINPKDRKIRFDLVQALIAAGSWPEAEKQMDVLIADPYGNAGDLNYKGLINLWTGQPEQALKIFQRVLESGHQDAFVYHNISAALTQLSYFDRGQWFLARALGLAKAHSRGKLMLYLALLENRYRAGDEFGAQKATYQLLAEYGLDEVLNVLKQLPGMHTFPPLDVTAIRHTFMGHLTQIAQPGMMARRSFNQTR